MIFFKKPIKAVWKNKNHDVPVLVKGFDEQNGKLFFLIKESKTGLPAEEMLFPKDISLEDILEKELKDDHD